MYSILKKATAAAVLSLMVGFGAVQASEDEAEPTHFPIKQYKEMDWSFGGPFGKWDIGQLQRGLKIYTEVCAACHSMNLLSYRNLEALGYNEDQIKAYAAEYEVTDGPNGDGDMFERPARPSDRFVPPFPNKEAAAASNNGAYPPDMTLLAKARAPLRGFPTFIIDIFRAYAENGPDYIYSLLTGYEDAPAGMKISEGTHYNPYFISGKSLAMAPPLSDELISYEDGTPETVDQYAKDITAFLMWAAEPTLVSRKAMGFKVMAFLFLFAGLLFYTKKKIWSDVAH